MKLLVDGVSFSLASIDGGISRIWSSILPRLNCLSGLEVALLDRGNCPVFSGVERVEFPSYKLTANTAADSFLIEKYCRELGADVFLSSYYTTPISTPSVLVVYDMTPEILKLDLGLRRWQEKQVAISFASFYACISESIRSELIRFYPSARDRAIVTYNGVERNIFQPRDESSVNTFKEQYGIAKPYFLCVWPQRLAHDDFNRFKEAMNFCDVEFDFIFIGVEHPYYRICAKLPYNGSIKLDLVDTELACAYSGAQALVIPFCDEASGIPVLEALACGCPVIAERCESLIEIAGEATIFLSGHDGSDLHCAMASLRNDLKRAQLKERALYQATRFNWNTMAKELYSLLTNAWDESKSVSMQRFFERWAHLRRIQLEVDTSV